MEWKVLTMDKSIESTFESELEPDALMASLSGSLNTNNEPIGYFFYADGLIENLITSASIASASLDVFRVLANEHHYEMILAQNP